MPHAFRRFVFIQKFLLISAFLLALVEPALAQGRLDKEGVTIYWGFVPAAVVSEKHALDDMHGGRPGGGGQVHHLVVALYDTTSGRRIDNAVVRAQLSESGIVDDSRKYLTPMPINGQMSYGQVFSVAKAGPYRFHIWARPPGRKTDIEFAISAFSPHLTDR
ncbi:hypothetical protein [Curvibacter delicatus]|jgi:hypothetical protein|uniref:hypothetical protein n=1 Tax=Curvibacter delicatus TaxID=80879 RepID=UPI000AA4DA35|nr:hypothetical protein [Curvibacter delicatus]